MVYNFCKYFTKCLVMLFVTFAHLNRVHSVPISFTDPLEQVVTQLKNMENNIRWSAIAMVYI